METASYFPDYLPQNFIKRRYSPLVAVFVDPEADRMLTPCGFSFVDIVSALGISQNSPIRFAPVDRIKGTGQDVLLQQIMSDVTTYSQSFILPEYEIEEIVDQALSPIPYMLKKYLRYPSPDSTSPPWYRTLVQRVVSSQAFLEFDFFDLPQCLLYVTAAESSFLSPNEIRSALPFPDWMKEFLLSIPVVRVIVYDTLVKSEMPKEINGPRGGFHRLMPFPFRTRRMNQGGGIEIGKLQNLFRYDLSIVNNPNLGQFISEQDILNVNKFISTLQNEVVLPSIDILIKSLVVEAENYNKLTSSIKSWFNKGSVPEPVTAVLGIPRKKIVYSFIGGLYLITGQYSESQKAYKSFVSLIEGSNCHYQRLSSMFVSSILNCVIPNNTNLVETGIAAILSEIHLPNSVQFLLYVPLLMIEFHSAMGEITAAQKLCKATLSKISKLWNGSQINKQIVSSVLMERLAGLTIDSRRSALLTSYAMYSYKDCNQLAHALRCAIWLQKTLPRSNWVLLYQTAWFEKAKLFYELTQGYRSLLAYKELLSLPDLDTKLHESVITQLWAPYNDPQLQKYGKTFRISSLLEIKTTKLIDKSNPEYWNHKVSNFDSLNQCYDKFHAFEMDRSINKTFDIAWMNESNKLSKSTKVGKGCKVYISLVLYNRYIFVIHLEHAQLFAECSNGLTYPIKPVKNIDIPGFPIRQKEIIFEFSPEEAGDYIIKKFEKNYWGCIQTEVEIDPIQFTCIEQYSDVKLSIEGLPDRAPQYQCFFFDAILSNVGNIPSKKNRIVFDNCDSIVYNGDQTSIENGSIITLNETIEPGSKIRLPLIYRATKPEKETLSFILLSEGIKCGFNSSIVSVDPSAVIETVIKKRCDDSNGELLYCTLAPQTNGVSFVGIIDQNGNKLQNFAPQSVLSIQTKNSILAFTGTSIGVIEDKWRIKLMSGAPYAILYSINQGLYAQKNLKVIHHDGIHLNVAIPPIIQVLPNEIISFDVLIEGSDSPPLFIEPFPFERNQPAKWIGKSKVRIVDDKATFKLRPLSRGIVTIQGFYLFTQNGVIEVHLKQRVSIEMNKNNI